MIHVMANPIHQHEFIKSSYTYYNFITFLTKNAFVKHTEVRPNQYTAYSEILCSSTCLAVQKVYTFWAYIPTPNGSFHEFTWMLFCSTAHVVANSSPQFLLNLYLGIFNKWNYKRLQHLSHVSRSPIRAAPKHVEKPVTNSQKDIIKNKSEYISIMQRKTAAFNRMSPPL